MTVFRGKNTTAFKGLKAQWGFQYWTCMVNACPVGNVPVSDHDLNTYSMSGFQTTFNVNTKHRSLVLLQLLDIGAKMNS